MKPNREERQSVKSCPTHRRQGKCIDTRQHQGHVRRRYVCQVKGCERRWTTIEHRVDVNKHGRAVEEAFVSEIRQSVRKDVQLELRTALEAFIGKI